MKLKHLLIFGFVFILSCQNEDKTALSETYLNELNTYKDKIDKGRVKYLQLTGLFKLDSLQTFGKSKSNDFVFDVIDIPEKLGAIKQQDSFTIIPEENIVFTSKNDTISISQSLPIDDNGNSIRMHYKHVNWQIITRSGSKYLRVWDEKNPAIEAFKGFDYYEPNSKMIFEGDFTYYDTKKEASVKSQLGVNANTNFIGKITFTHNDETHSLDVGSSGFTMVGDLTTGDNTYGGGRYIYLDLPENDGKVTLDFNYLYNPPCSFNSYTTCLYPPRQNHLPFEILAGETIKKQ